MGLSLPHIPKWLRTSAVFILLCAVSSITYLPAISSSPSAHAPDASPSVYLPVTMKQSAASSFELIDTAFQLGQIDAETALEYKVFAVFDDARLPEGYRSSEVGPEAGLFMNEVVAAYPTLSAAAKAVVEPFFIPPYQPGSWAEQEARSLAPTAPGDWAYISAASGRARVWYKTGNAELQRKAGVVASALNNDIWDEMIELMGDHPVYDEAGVQNFVIFHRYRDGWNSSFVPFSGAYGAAVPQTCSQTASIIYINPAKPDIGDSTKGGLKDTTAHEFMHALQFAFPLAVDPCHEYRWMGEATATWAEDFIYPDVNSEWMFAQAYLDSTELGYLNRYNGRDYGEYLLVYWFTQKFTDDDAVRRAWESAGSLDSLKSFAVFGNLDYMQLAALWNRPPFDTFFLNSESFVKVAKPTAYVILTPTGGFTEYSMPAELEPGGALFFRFKFDPTVHTISFLNGLDTKITYAGSSGDTVYFQDNVSPEDSRGADVVTMIKFEGLDAPYIQPNPGRWDICLDWLPQKATEIVVILANNDTENRNRLLESTGMPSKIMGSTVPCMKVTGTASLTRNGPGDVVETLTASGLEYTFAAYDELTPDSRYENILLPNIMMRLRNGSVSWQISGTDEQGCTHSGSDNFTITENNYSTLQLEFQLLPGSQHYNGYVGNSLLDYGSYVTKTVTCP